MHRPAVMIKLFSGFFKIGAAFLFEPAVIIAGLAVFIGLGLIQEIDFKAQFAALRLEMVFAYVDSCLLYTSRCV